MYPGFDSREAHDFLFFFFMFFFFFFFFVIVITVQIQHYCFLLRFSYFITPYDAQASSAFSALIFKDFYDNNSNNNNLKGLFIQGKKEYHKCFVSIVTNEGIDLKHAS